MGETTGIAWTDHTFNPWWGCQRVSPGCEHCYAEALDKRVGGGIDPADNVKKLRWGPLAPRIRTSRSNWQGPLSWNKKAERLGRRERVFCASMADVFEARPELEPWRADLFKLIQATPWLDWQLLTKRPHNLEKMLPWSKSGAPWPNVWIGTTVEDQERAELRIPRLRAAPAAVRFLSVEPMIEAIDLKLDSGRETGGPLGWVDDPRIDWVIVGGESGGAAREFDLSWAHDIRRQCTAAGVAFFMKQLGARAVSADPECGNDEIYSLADAHGAEWNGWPARAASLKVRDFPRAR